MATIPEAFAIAVQHYQAGRLQAAEQICRQILAVQPNHADAIHLLGVIAAQVGKCELAVEYIGRAIGLQGSVASFHNNLGEAYRALRRIPEAVACYRRALELKPDFAAAHYNLDVALTEQGELDQAVACYRRALDLKPDYAEAHLNLGNALREQGNLDAADGCLAAVRWEAICDQFGVHLVRCVAAAGRIAIRADSTELILHAAQNDTNPKRKRGPQLVPSLALRVSMKRVISNRRVSVTALLPVTARERRLPGDFPAGPARER